MILRLTDEEYLGDSFVVGVDELPHLDAMVERAAVQRGSLAFDLVATIHRGIAGRAPDIKRDYLTYFAKEYPDARDYVWHRHRVARGHLDEMGVLFANYRHVLLYEPSMSVLRGEAGHRILESLLGEARRE